MGQSVALESIIALLRSIFIPGQVICVTAGKDGEMGEGELDVSFVSSGSGWSKDLDGIKSHGPSAQSANLSPEIGYGAYPGTSRGIIGRRF